MTPTTRLPVTIFDIESIGLLREALYYIRTLEEENSRLEPEVAL